MSTVSIYKLEKTRK